jgi:hypothetical protein
MVPAVNSLAARRSFLRLLARPIEITAQQPLLSSMPSHSRSMVRRSSADRPMCRGKDERSISARHTASSEARTARGMPGRLETRPRSRNPPASNAASVATGVIKPPARRAATSGSARISRPVRPSQAAARRCVREANGSSGMGVEHPIIGSSVVLTAVLFRRWLAPAISVPASQIA